MSPDADLSNQPTVAPPPRPEDQPTLAPARDPGSTLPPGPPTDTTTAAPDGDDSPPGYVIESELGRGGMGVVYKARHVSLNRTVALKMVLSGGHASSQELVRFLAEAEAIAALRHPHVVQIFEIGRHKGRPFFTLEFCDGGGLEKKLAGSPLPPREAAAVVEMVARGVEAAHALGIIHRDLKPQNVLLAGGVPKVTDFGLAKRVGSGSDLTATGAVMGTPSYMAPEQAAGKGKEVGPTADVYALGAVLYECLTGRPPFRAATVMDTLLQVMTTDPVPPRDLNPFVPADLETVCLKCLHKEPARRYPTAAAVGDDLNRWLAGEPITARPVGRLERGWKWVRRNRATAVAGACVATALLLGTVVSAWQAVRASDEAVHAKDAEKRAEEQAGIATRNAADAKAQEALAREEQRKAEAAADALKRERAATTIRTAFTDWKGFNGYNSRALLNTCPPEYRGWEWDFQDRLHEYSSTPLRGHSNMLVGLASSPDGKRVYTTAADGTTRVWDPKTGFQERLFKVQGYRLAVAPDGRLAVAVGGKGIVQFLAPDSGAVTGQFPTGALLAMAFVRAGRELVTVDASGTLVVRDPATGAERSRVKLTPAPDPQMSRLMQIGLGGAVSPDGQWVACGGKTLQVWDAATGKRVVNDEWHLKAVGQVAFRPDGKFLASPGGEGDIAVWDTATWQRVRTLRGHSKWVWAVAYSPDGTRLVSGAKDTTVRLWDPDSGELLITHVGHVSEVWAVGFTGDGANLLSGSADRTARVWLTDTGVVYGKHVAAFFASKTLPRFGAGAADHLTFYGHLGRTNGVALSPDGKWFASVSVGDDKAAHQITLWDIDARTEVLKIPSAPGVARYPLFTPDGAHLLIGEQTSGGKASRVSAYTTASDKPVWTWDGPPAGQTILAVNRAGDRLSVSAQRQNDLTLVVLDPATRRELSRRTLPGTYTAPAFAPDGRHLVLAHAHKGVVMVFAADTSDTAPVRQWPASDRLVVNLACSSAGVVATADGKADITLWNLADGMKQRTLAGHVGLVAGLAFNPDGGRLFTAASDFTARVWDTATGHEMLTFQDHADSPLEADWSRDGSRLATACQDGAVRVWDGPRPDLAAAADRWPVVYANRFDTPTDPDRVQKVLGNWTFADGAACGTQAELKLPGLSFNVARIALPAAFKLPRLADVRFRFRAGVPQAASIILADATGQRFMYQPILAGRCRIPNSPVSYIQQLTFPTADIKDMQQTNLGGEGKFDMQAGRWHAVRVLREPDRLRVWVDGAPLLAERIADIDLPVVALQGSWADVGDAIEFDDIEVRAPAADKPGR